MSTNTNTSRSLSNQPRTNPPRNAQRVNNLSRINPSRTANPSRTTDPMGEMQINNEQYAEEDEDEFDYDDNLPQSRNNPEITNRVEQEEVVTVRRRSSVLPRQIKTMINNPFTNKAMTKTGTIHKSLVKINIMNEDGEMTLSLDEFENTKNMGTKEQVICFYEIKTKFDTLNMELKNKLHTIITNELNDVSKIDKELEELERRMSDLQMMRSRVSSMNQM